MATEKRWTAYDSIQTYLTTDLNSLTNNGLVIGSAIDFTASGTDRKLYIDIELYLASIDLSSQDNPAAYIWLLRRTDGTNFEDGSASITPARMPDDIIPLREANAAQRISGKLITVPDQGKILIKNKSGVTWASSGNTLKYNIYSIQDA